MTDWLSNKLRGKNSINTPLTNNDSPKLKSIPIPTPTRLATITEIYYDKKELYEFDEILDHKKIGKGISYLIR